METDIKASIQITNPMGRGGMFGRTDLFTKASLRTACETAKDSGNSALNPTRECT